jgi:hypothetical protein
VAWVTRVVCDADGVDDVEPADRVAAGDECDLPSRRAARAEPLVSEAMTKSSAVYFLMFIATRRRFFS